ncbi:MAG: ATP-binding protein [Muribaculaceae bacterium]
MCTIIGRQKEIAELKRHLNSGRAEFIAVYGRRRVGKTFLINEIFRDNMAFHHTGLSPYDRTRKVSLKDQLENFYFSLIRNGMEGGQCPKTWMEAFFMLEQLLENKDNGTRQVVFIDELPWMDTARSGFMTALEAFWNGWGNTQHQLCFVVCGSGTSWMLDNLINNKGGLYGRLTGELKLSPFTLKECEDFYLSRGIKMSRYNVAQAYMIMGGIPFYMNYFNPSLSLAQNIDELFFCKRAKLGDEFTRLFNSIFDNAEACMSIVNALGKRHKGLTRSEIANATGLNPNGDFSKLLKALICSDFIIKYIPFASKKREEYYKLIDPFCLFWLHFKQNKKITETDYWQHHLKESEIASWRGLAFEDVCLQHIMQIKQTLQIGGVSSEESSYVITGDGENYGAQIDLIINRADDVINLCEIKFTKQAFTLTKKYEEILEHRKNEIENLYPNKTVHLTLIATSASEECKNSGVFQSIVTLDNLFL